MGSQLTILTSSDLSWLNLVRKSDVVADGVEGLAEVAGERLAAVMTCCPALISISR
jgi:hypothetical protein